MISEKDKMIVEAINKSKGLPIDIEYSYGYINVAKARGKNRTFPSGEIHAVDDSYSDEYCTDKHWKFICTIKEFNQCIKEMSEAKWMQKTIEEIMINAKESKMQKVFKEGVKLEVGMMCNYQGNPYTVDYIGNVLSVISNESVAFEIAVKTKDIKHLKSKEELELEVAKSKQVDRIINTYSEHFNDGGHLSDIIEMMQENGDLAEALLPLEPKQ